MKPLWLFAAVVVACALARTESAVVQEQSVDQETESAVVQEQSVDQETGESQELVFTEDEERYVHCDVSGDPELSNFNLQRATVPFPCFYHLADMRLEFNENSSAAEMGYDFFIVEVLASADLQPFRGRYFTGLVSIKITAYAYIEGTELFTPVDEGTYKTSSSDLETFWNSGQTPQDKAAVWHIDSTFPDGVVITGFDAGARVAFLKLLRENNPPLWIGFRARNKEEGIPQTFRPGIFISARRGRMKKHQEARFPGTLCSTKSDNRTLKEIRGLGRYGGRLDNNRQLMLYTTYTQALNKGIPQTEPKCDDAVAAFKGCSGEAKRQQAMYFCSNLTVANTVKCLERPGMVTGTALVAFTKCVNVCCDVDKANSQAWLNTVGAFCPLSHLP